MALADAVVSEHPGHRGALTTALGCRVALGQRGNILTDLLDRWKKLTPVRNVSELSKGYQYRAEDAAKLEHAFRVAGLPE